MKKLLIVLLLIFIGAVPQSVYAVENPLSVPNNKFGVHILFPEEFDKAADLVNSNGGKWGYVTIPIQAGDRDLEKWQGFMNKTKELQIIPIIRLAIENDYFNTIVWRKPTFADVLDFANFLNSLNWPTKNRYIVVFNEPNRGDEWGGFASPSEYAQILSYAATAFKKRNKDFFVISAGLDNAAANNSYHSINQYLFLQMMNEAVPGIFSQIDGLASHSYPNPAFSQPPSSQNRQGVASFNFERNLVKSISGKSLPIFITETGWVQDKVPDYIISLYYKDVFSSLWADESIVAVTPFLLQAYAGPFLPFSLVKSDGSPTAQYVAIKSLPKIKGTPILSSEPKIAASQGTPKTVLGTRSFSSQRAYLQSTFPDISAFKTLLKWLLKL